MRSALFVCILFLTSFSIVYAQAACPADVLLDLGRAASACYGPEQETVCSGNGAVNAIGFDGAGLISQPGDRATAALIETLTIASSPDEFGVASLTLRADLPALSQRNITILAFGEVTLVNKIIPLPQLTALATGLANIRTSPHTDAEIIGQAVVNNVFMLDGRTSDGQWVRAQVRGEDIYGWVAVQVLNVQGDVRTLAVVDEQAVVQRAFEVLELSAGEASFCGDALRSGVLIQTPNVTDPVTFTLNDTRLSLAGTAFITGESAFEVYVLQGFAVSGDSQAFIPMGAWGSTDQPAKPFNTDLLVALPLHMLPVTVRVPATITADEITRLTSEYEAQQVALVATPQPLPTIDPTVCSRETRRDTSLYAGPGNFYETINDIRAGQRLDPILQTNDPDGGVWWQLRSSNWISVTEVRQTGECDEVPRAQIVLPPTTNTLSLETCETTNGPLRAGQQVTIEFTPPPWDNWGEARDAVRIDPGRITIGRRTYRTQATEPIQLGTAGPDDRYLRRFYLIWTAEPGTFRIVGDRLSYEPICTLTVPVG